MPQAVVSAARICLIIIMFIKHQMLLLEIVFLSEQLVCYSRLVAS